jgi:ubiquinone/menaquinone biosynthesis C-methylase UbiE
MRESDGKIPNLNKNKISGIFNAEKNCGDYTNWDEFYKKKKKRSRDKNLEITEKHLMYYEALKNLGFFDNLTHNSIVLQLGVGHGQSLRTIIEKQTYIQPIGLDISFEALSFFKKNSSGNDVELICGDVLSLPFSNESIDRCLKLE